MKCPNCGKEIAEGSVFCEFCGAQVAKPKKSHKVLWITLVVLILIGTVGGIVYHQNELQKEKIAEANRLAESERLAREDAELKVKESEKAKQKAESDRKKAEKRAKEAEKISKEKLQEGFRTEISAEEERKASLLKQGYVDLGLPSGTLWKKNTEGQMHYNTAMHKYGSAQIPTKQQWEELQKQCKWEWIDQGVWIEQYGERYKESGDCYYRVSGKNGNYIILMANGYYYVEENLCVGCGYFGGVIGNYISSTRENNSLWVMMFDSSDIKCGKWDDFFSNQYELSVQLVKD